MRLFRRTSERGVAIYVTAALLVMIVPMMALAIDVTLLYVTKARLQGAVDGAALEGARSLARGSDGPSQVQAAKDTAVAYVNLNYPTSYFFSSAVTVDPNNDVSIDLTVANQRTISVTGHVTVPEMFMLWFSGGGSHIVTASAQTVRKDVNIVLVLDRSGSMTASGSCGPMKQAAINFVANFAPGRDNLGLISFATSTIVQLPITTGFTQAGMTTAINGIDCQGSTSSAAGIWTAYDQLVNLNQTAALNFIVFFTDGEPTGVAANMPIAAGSPCSENVTKVPPDAIPAGFPAGFSGRYIRGMYATYVDGSAFIGLAKDTAAPDADGTPPSSSTSPTNDQVVAPNSTGCAYAASWNGNWQTISDFRGIPTVDIYGNSLTGYQALTALSGGYIDITHHENGIPLATNAADDAARRIRIGTSDPVYGRGLNGVIVDAIGLGNAPVPLPADGIFLERVTNDPRSPIYSTSYPAGLYVYAQESSDIGSAFGQIASEILRLAK